MAEQTYLKVGLSVGITGTAREESGMEVLVDILTNSDRSKRF